MGQAEILKILRAGAVIIVRAKNGRAIPMFHWKPDAYRCTLDKQLLPARTVSMMMNRRLIEPVKVGWYSEGHFRINNNLRDERGRFRPSSAPHTTP